jgi:hypothetical protein
MVKTDVKQKPVKQEIIRDSKGRFPTGVSGNPEGRPKGQTLKEYQAQKFRDMSEEEKEIFLKDVAKELQWRMAEGNPYNNVDLEIKGTLNIDVATRTKSKQAIRELIDGDS